MSNGSLTLACFHRSRAEGRTQVAGLVGLGPGQGVGLLGAPLVLVLQRQVAQLDQAAALVQQQVLQLHLPAGRRVARRGSPWGGCWPAQVLALVQGCPAASPGQAIDRPQQTPAARTRAQQLLQVGPRQCLPRWPGATRSTIVTGHKRTSTRLQAGDGLRAMMSPQCVGVDPEASTCQWPPC